MRREASFSENFKSYTLLNSHWPPPLICCEMRRRATLSKHFKVKTRLRPGFGRLVTEWPVSKNVTNMGHRMTRQQCINNRGTEWPVSKNVNNTGHQMARQQRSYQYGAPNDPSAKTLPTRGTKWPVSKTLTTRGMEWPVSKNVTNTGRRMTRQQKRYQHGAPNDPSSARRLPTWGVKWLFRCLEDNANC